MKKLLLFFLFLLCIHTLSAFGDGVLTAVQGDDLAKLKAVLSDEDLQEKTPGGSSLLHVAAEYGAVKIFKYLVDEKGMDYEEKDSLECSVFHKAASADAAGIIKYLVEEKNLDPSVPDKYGATALHRAASAGALNAVKDLINTRQMDPMATDHFGDTALHKAAAGGAMNVMKYFLDDKGLSLKVKNGYGDTPLRAAVRHGKTEMARYLIEDRRMNAQELNLQKENLLFAAVSCCNVPLELLQYLADEKGVSAKTKNSRGETALIPAAGLGNVEAVKFLTIRKGLSLNEVDRQANTLLHLAAARSRLDIVKYLVETGHLSVTAKNKESQTPYNMIGTAGRTAASAENSLVQDYLYAREQGEEPSADPETQERDDAIAAEGAKRPLPEKEISWKYALNRRWRIHYDQAMEEARRKNKKLLVLDTISGDSCEPCVKLENEVLNEDLFNRYADKAFVLLVLDSSSSGKKMPESQLLHNEIVRQRVRFANVVPCAAIIDPETGKKLGMIPGFMDLDHYLIQLSGYTDAKVPMEEEAENDDGETPDGEGAVTEKGVAGAPDVSFPVYSGELPAILPGDRKTPGFFALMKSEKMHVGLILHNQTAESMKVQVIPLADSWNTDMVQAPVELRKGQRLRRKITFRQSACCRGVRVYWKTKNMTEPKFKDYLCKDSGDVPRVGKTVQFFAWGTGKGPLKKENVESLEDGKKLFDAFTKKDRITFSNMTHNNIDANARYMDNENLEVDSVLRLICRNAENTSDIKTYLDPLMRCSPDLQSVIRWDKDFPCGDKSCEVLKYLFQHGIDPNHRGSGRCSLLDAAMLNPAETTSEMYALLFQYGVNPNQVMSMQSSDSVGKVHSRSIAEPMLIRLTKAYLPYLEQENMAKEFPEIFHAFLKAKANPNTKLYSFSSGVRTENILHFLAKQHANQAICEAFKLLLDHSAKIKIDPNSTDSPEKNTALFYLAEQDTLWARNAARILIKNGCNVRYRNMAGDTAVDRAGGEMKTLLQHSGDKAALEPETDK